jgi:hypothetical protein
MNGFDGGPDVTHAMRLAAHTAAARARHARDLGISEDDAHMEEKLLLDAIDGSDTWLDVRVYRESLDSFTGSFLAAHARDEGISCTILTTTRPTRLLVVTRDDGQDGEQLVRRHIVEVEGAFDNEAVMHLIRRAVEAHFDEDAHIG